MERRILEKTYISMDKQSHDDMKEDEVRVILVLTGL